MSVRARRVFGWAMIAITVGACGPTSIPVAESPAPTFAESPSPTLTEYDRELLAELRAVDFEMYETSVTIGSYVFGAAGLNYERNTLQLSYGGLGIDEWKAVAFNPASGKCSTVDPRFTWNCVALASSPGGNMLYAGPAGGLPGYPPNLGDVYVELGSTVVHLHSSAGHSPTLADLKMFADGLALVTAEQVVSLNQEARAYAQHLHDTASSRIDFKTYLPRQNLLNFTLDRKGIDNPTDPLHPYVYLHFQRVANGNEAFEFTADEFRDDVPVSASHCGIGSPELRSLYDRCAFWFTTPGGIAVFSTYSSTRFDRGSTRIVVWFSAAIDGVAQEDMSRFVDSFAEVAPREIA